MVYFIHFKGFSGFKIDKDFLYSIPFPSRNIQKPFLLIPTLQPPFIKGFYEFSNPPVYSNHPAYLISMNFPTPPFIPSPPIIRYPRVTSRI